MHRLHHQLYLMIFALVNGYLAIPFVKEDYLTFSRYVSTDIHSALKTGNVLGGQWKFYGEAVGLINVSLWGEQFMRRLPVVG